MGNEFKTLQRPQSILLSDKEPVMDLVMRCSRDHGGLWEQRSMGTGVVLYLLDFDCTSTVLM